MLGQWTEMDGDGQQAMDRNGRKRTQKDSLLALCFLLSTFVHCLLSIPVHFRPLSQQQNPPQTKFLLV